MELYLDHASTTKIHPEVMSVVNESYRSHFANPSSAHRVGYEAHQRISQARESLLHMVNGRNHGLVFTNGGTEANNLAILGLANQHRLKTLQWVCSKIEHPSVIKVYGHLQHLGADTAYLPVNREGLIDLEMINDVMKETTGLVSIMHVNNETGIIQPVKEAIRLIRKTSKKALIHVDGVQAFGKIPLDLEDLNADMYSVSSHKICGPRGIGALFIHKKINLEPVFWGGGQESGLRPGTENTPAIMGFEKAALLRFSGRSENSASIKKIREKLIKQLKQIGGIQFIEHSDPEQQAPNILTICVEHCKSEVILRMLSDDGIYLSAGSACSSRKTTASYVLTAMNIKPSAIEGAFRISFDETFTEEQQAFFISRFQYHMQQMIRITKR